MSESTIDVVAKTVNDAVRELARREAEALDLILLLDNTEANRRRFTVRRLPIPWVVFANVRERMTQRTPWVVKDREQFTRIARCPTRDAAFAYIDDVLKHELTEGGGADGVTS